MGYEIYTGSAAPISPLRAGAEPALPGLGGPLHPLCIIHQDRRRSTKVYPPDVYQIRILWSSTYGHRPRTRTINKRRKAAPTRTRLMPLLRKSRTFSQRLSSTRKEIAFDTSQASHYRTGGRITVGKRRRPSVRGERKGPEPVCGRPSSTTEPLKITNSFDSLNPEVPCTSVHNVRMSYQAESIDLPCILESKN